MVFAYLLLRGDMDAPDWMRTRVEAGIARSVPDGDLAFDDLQFRLDGDTRPIVQMRNAVLSGPDGDVIFELADLQAELSRRALLGGRFAPKKLILSGAFLDVMRAEDGAIELSFEQNNHLNTVDGAGTLATLLGALEYDSLSLLETVEVEALSLIHI